MKKHLLLFGSLLCLTLPGISQAQTAPRTKTAHGTVEGLREASGILAFKGIPFAAPPVGNLRWKAPQPVTPWKGVRQATQFGPRAMQAPIFGDMMFRSNGMGEDCLYLNVWTPNLKGKLPVLVYFYGGGFVAGDGSEGRYDGESMAKQGIVSVTLNYRLGIFGSFAHPELSKEAPYGGSGNYGLLDQAAALKWVHQNIAHFGGDPKKITIAGESAGSSSVSAQMASPLSRHLIAGAIGESGSILGTLPPVPLADAEKTGLGFAKEIGAPALADLRKIPAEKLLDAVSKFGNFRFPLTIDGHFFPKEPVAIFNAGEQAQVPLLLGWNSEEMNARAIMGNDAPTKENFANVVRKLYGDQSDAILAAYTPASDSEVEQVATELAGDRFIGFSTWRWSQYHQKTGAGQPVYRYFYTRPRPPMVPEMGDAVPGLAGGVQQGSGQPKPPIPKGAVHSAEIEYCMGNLHYNKVFAWTEDDHKVSQTMQAYFANFIKTGNPNGNGLPQWPTAQSSKPTPVMIIDVNSQVVPDRFAPRYELLEKMANKK
ncbi:MAG: carboxylesterase/lipase family protein [Saprospiraceae bacterium]